MKQYLGRLAVLVLMASLCAAQQKHVTHPVKPRPVVKPETASLPKLPSEETVNAFLEQMFGYNPSVSWKVADIRPSKAEGLAEVSAVLTGPQGSNGIKFYVTADGTHVVIGDVLPFGAHPFAADAAKLQQEGNGVSRGPATASVTIVEFSDFQCPHCKAAQPVLDKLLVDEPNTRLVFQNFPLPMHDWSGKAANYAECIGHASNDSFWKFIGAVFEAQNDLTAANADEKLSAIADLAGVKGTEIAVCAAKPETAAAIEHSVALGKSLDITGTPTLFINGRKVSNLAEIPYEVLKQLVEFSAKAGK